MTANDLDNVESKWSTEGWWHRRSRQVQRRARRQRYWCVILQLHISHQLLLSHQTIIVKNTYDLKRI